MSFNPRLTAIAAAGAFVLSLLISLFSGAGLALAFLRAIGMAALMAAIASAAWVVIARFLPELMGDSPGGAADDSFAAPPVGSSVDIVVGDDQEAAAPGAEVAGIADAVDAAEYGSDPSPFGVQNAGASSGTGLDQGPQAGYTSEDSPGQEDYEPGGSAQAARPPELAGDVDVLPDLEGMSDSFVTPISGDEEVHEERTTRSAPVTVPGAPAGTSFDPKEIALAVQTILKRDREG